MAKSFTMALDMKIGKLEKQLEKLRAIRAGFDDPEIAEMLFALNDAGPDSENTRTPRFRVIRSGRRKESQFDRLATFFAGRGNEPATMMEMVKGTDLNRGAVSSVVYTQRAGDFEKITDKEPYRWKLKEPAARSASASSGA